MRFGISTHLFHDRRLQRDDLALVASYGFETIELFATRSHFDYHDEDRVASLGDWLRETGLTLHSVHAPIAESFDGTNWGESFTTAAGDERRRLGAVEQAAAALAVAPRVPFDVLVLHLGTPADVAGADDNQRAAAAHSLDEICGLAAPLGVRVAVEVIPNRLSEPAALVALLERDGGRHPAGICLDVGHAHLIGDVADAVETVAEHLIATHIHDNHGRQDEHLVPFAGSIEWGLTLATLQKVGYEGTYLMELAGRGPAATILEEARRARHRFERALEHA